MAADRYSRPDEFLALYLRYRLDDMIAYQSRRAHRGRRRRALSGLILLGLLMLVTISYVLGNVDRGLVKVWVVAGTGFAAASLALGIGMIAFGLGRQADIHGSTAAALNRMRARKPGPTASAAEVEGWVWQTEAIISSAMSDVGAASGQLPPVRADRGIS
jgi:hypothetical protein